MAAGIEFNPIPVVDPAPDYNPTPDEDGFIAWITVVETSAEMDRRLAALAALMAATRIGFKLKYNDTGYTAMLCVQKPNCKALEVLWNLTNLVDVQAPPVLKINLNDMFKSSEGQQAFEQVPEIEGSRFDEL